MNELSHDKAEVQKLFTAWTSYKKVVDHNYMYHREAYAAVHERLRQRSEPFSFLELACGDASCTVPALLGTKVSEYTGVDFARPALVLAQQTIKELPCPAKLIEQDFVEFLGEAKRKWDVIYIGLSYHHLKSEEKEGFARQVHARLNPGGTWIFFEPVHRPEETRAEYTERWWQHIQANWTENTLEELESFHAHVSQYDYPETLAGYGEVAKAAGFASTEMLYGDPDFFYAVLGCEV